MRAQPDDLQTLIDSAPVHLFAVDQDYRYTAFNHGHAQHTLDFFGVRIEIGGSCLEAITDPVAREKARRALDRALAGEQFVDLAFWPQVNLPGPAVEITFSPRQNLDGAVCGVVVMVRELSDAFYRSLFEDLSAALLFFDVQDGAILDANPAACDFYGYSRAELTRLHIGDISAQAHDDNRQGVRQITAGELKQMVTRHRLANGDVREVEVTMGRHKLGERLINIAAIHDITGRRQTEELLLSANALLEQRVHERTAALRRSNHILKLFVEHAPAAIAMFDRQMNYLAASRRFRQDYGLGEQELAGRSHYAVFPDLPERWKATHQRCLAGAVEQCAADPFPRQDGTLDWVRWEIHPWYENPGQVGGIVLFSEVITARKQAESALHEAQVRLAAIISAANLGTWEWNIQTGETVFNERWAEIVGYKLAELAPISIQTWVDLAHPDDLETSNARLNEVFAGQRAYYDVECRMKHRLGHWVWVQDSGSVTVWTPDGKPLTMSGTHMDITARKQAEAEIRLRNQLVELSHEPILVWDLERGIVEWNAGCENLYGYTRQEAAGQVSHTLLRARHPAPLEDCLAELARAGRWSGEVSHWTKTGQEIIVDSRQEVLAHDGRHLVLETNRDITAEKHARAALEESAGQLQMANAILEKAMRARDEFLAATSHELRIPLTGILGFAEVLQLNLYGALNEQQLKAVENIRSSSERLLAVLNDVLIYAQIQSGGLLLSAGPCSLDDVCQACLAAVWEKASAKQQHLDYTTTPAAILVNIDATRLKRALVNLLDNAVKFTPSGGRIELAVSLQPQAGEARLSVRDTGIGIQAEELPRLFQPFVQLDARLARLFQHSAQFDARLARPYEGTGLGLALVKGIVELHGGRVEVASVFGQGSTFTIVLPWRA